MMFATRAEIWAFLAVACAVAFIVALLLAGCQMPLRTAGNISLLVTLLVS